MGIMTEQMTISDAEQAAVSTKIKASPVLSNAFRLMKDAELLFKAKSYASAVALACLAIEEIGKFLLAAWSSANEMFTYDRGRLHLSKLTAIAAMLLADSMRREYKAQNIDPSEAKISEWLLALIQAVSVGFESESHTLDVILSQDRGLNIIRQTAMYYDEDRATKGVAPDNINAEQAFEVMQLVSRSFMAIADEGAMPIANFMFIIIGHDLSKLPRRH